MKIRGQGAVTALVRNLVAVRTQQLEGFALKGRSSQLCCPSLATSCSESVAMESTLHHPQTS